MAAVMGISFLVNVLLLLGTAQLGQRRPSSWRLVLAAALGAAWSGICMMRQIGILSGMLFRTASLIAAALLAFGVHRDSWKPAGIFVLLTMALENTSGKPADWHPVALAFGIQLLARLGKGTRQFLPVEIAEGNRRIQITALRDTGNELRDPITGERVLIVDAPTAMTLTGLTLHQLRHPLDTVASAGMGFRLIPYYAVGSENGLLLAKRYPGMKIGGRKRGGLVAFAPQELGGEAYQALAGGV